MVPFLIAGHILCCTVCRQDLQVQYPTFNRTLNYTINNIQTRLVTERKVEHWRKQIYIKSHCWVAVFWTCAVGTWDTDRWCTLQNVSWISIVSNPWMLQYLTQRQPSVGIVLNQEEKWYYNTVAQVNITILSPMCPLFRGSIVSTSWLLQFGRDRVAFAEVDKLHDIASDYWLAGSNPFVVIRQEII